MFDEKELIDLIMQLMKRNVELEMENHGLKDRLLHWYNDTWGKT
jgi:regulator of replication initiation timing